MKSNPIIWCKIYVQDMERAKRFYETIFQAIFTLAKEYRNGEEYAAI
jgi:predicted enzyme related to lactoylglutathione lyase